jgi:peptide/nickel transport system substrate-binding protein
MKRSLVAGAALLALFAMMAFTSCKGTAVSSKAKTLVYGTTDKVTDMDTASAYDAHTWDIFQNVAQGLLAYTPGTTEIVPGLASKYEANASGDAYTFTLRSGMKFSDGSAFDAAAVKWSIDRVIALKGDPSWLVSDFVKEVTVKDPQTVVFSLKQPCAFFPALVATPTYFPVNPNDFPADKIVRDIGELKSGTLSGLGPYKLVSFKRDEEAVFEANPAFYGEKPNIPRIMIRYFADATTMRLSLEKGEVDLVYKSLNPSDVAALSQNPKFITNKLPGPQIRYICFETSQSVFKDKTLRQAVAALVNRPEVIQKVYLGQNSPLYSMIPNGMNYQTQDFKTVFGDGNVQLATDLLAKAGYSAAKPFKFDFWYTPSHYGDIEINMAEVLKAQFEKCPAIKVNLKSAEWAAYKDNWDKKVMPSFLLGWYPDYVDPDDYTAVFGGTTGSAGMGINFSDKNWDALFVKEQGSTDPAVRKDVFAQVQKLWTDEVITVPIWQGDMYIFTKPGISGAMLGPTLIFNYRELKMK